jgi:amino acid transporter
MAAAIPTAGGKYAYAKEAWGPVAGFVAGWAEIIVSRGFSGASKAVVIAGYATDLAGRGNVKVLAGTLVIAFTILHLGGLKFGTRFQNVTTILKIVVLLAIAAAGFMAGDASGFSETMTVAGGLVGPELPRRSVREVGAHPRGAAGRRTAVAELRLRLAQSNRDRVERRGALVERVGRAAELAGGQLRRRVQR